MIATMLAAVLVSVVGVPAAPAVGSVASVVSAGGSAPARAVTPPDEDPAVRVTLNSQNVYDAGDRARVRVHVRDDGYLFVLHADPSGAVRVLYPANPGDDDFVHGGQDLDVHGNGQDASFVVSTVRGTGTVYAAVSKDPFHFEALAGGNQWASNAFPDSARGENAEAVLTDVVQRSATVGGRFDYDLVSYTVTAHRQARSQYADGAPSSDYYPGDADWGPYGPYYDPWYGPSFGVAIGGPWWGFGYSPWYSPWYGAGFYPYAGFGFGGFGGCWGCGGFYGAYYGGYPGFYHGGFASRPGFVPPIGYRGSGGVFLASRAGLGGVPYQAHAGFAGRPAAFASARLTTAPGGIASGAYRSRAASPTVFRQVHASMATAQPGMGHVVTNGGGAARAVRANPVGGGAMAERVSVGSRSMGSPMGSRVGGAATGMRAPARAYRVAPQARTESSGGWGGGRAAGGGGGESPRSSGGGHSGGGAHYSGGGGHGGGGHGGGHR
jgi:hypothetical protein